MPQEMSLNDAVAELTRLLRDGCLDDAANRALQLVLDDYKQAQETRGLLTGLIRQLESALLAARLLGGDEATPRVFAPDHIIGKSLQWTDCRGASEP